MAKDTRVTFESAANNNGSNGAMPPNGMGGGNGSGSGSLGYGLGHHHNSNLAPHQQPPPTHHHIHHSNLHHPQKTPGKLGRGHSRMAERQVSAEDAENCINEISENFPALSNKAHRLMRQVSGTFNSRTLKVTLIFSIMLNIIMGITFGVFFGMWVNSSKVTTGESSSLSSSSGQQGHIGPSSQAFTGHHSGPFLPPSGHQTVQINGKTVNPALMAALGSKIASNENTIEAICAYCPARPCSDTPTSGGSHMAHGGSSSKPSSAIGGQDPPKCVCVNDALRSELKTLSAAHMMLDVHETKKMNTPIWMTHDAKNICYVGKGLRYADSKLTVLHTGKYFVYSQVTFSTVDNQMPEGLSDNLLLVFSIQRTPRSSSMHRAAETILLSKLSMEDKKEKNDSVGGVIPLSEGDVLSVYISHPSLLKNLESANYFGLYKL